MKDKQYFKFEYKERYYFPYTNEVGAGYWNWTGAEIDNSRLRNTGIFRTHRGAYQKSKELNNK